MEVRDRDAVIAAVLEKGLKGSGVDEAVYLLVWQEIAGDFRDTIEVAMARPGSWRERFRASGYAAGEWTNRNRRELRFALIEVRGTGELVHAYFDRLLNDLVDLIDEARQDLDDPDSMDRSVAQITVGSMATVIAKRLDEGDENEDAREWVPELMYIAARPYLGHEAALEEMKIQPPA
jgi:hypothetical protein